MNRREFMRRTLAVAAALGMPAGVGMAGAADEVLDVAKDGSVLTLADIERMKRYMDQHAIQPVDGYYYWYLPTK